MTLTAVFGFLGVLLGSAITAVVTLCRDQLTIRHEREARQAQREREREDRREAFQRESLLALQTALSELVRAAYREQDRMLAEMQRTGSWPVRRWETPTAEGWSDAYIQVQALRARVFDDELRSLAGEVAEGSGSIWSETIEEQTVQTLGSGSEPPDSTDASARYCESCTDTRELAPPAPGPPARIPRHKPGFAPGHRC
jgi:hypothetical protein